MRPGIAIVIGVLLGASSLSTLPASANDVQAATQVTARQIDSDTEIRLSDMVVVSAQPSADGMELSLQFSKPVSEAVARAVLERASPAITDASTGYDSLLMRGRSPSLFDVQQDGSQVVVKVKPISRSADDSRFALLEIRRLSMLDDTSGARSLVADLRRARPDDLELYRAEAEVDLADHNYRTAAAKLRSLLRDRPADEGLRESLAEAESHYGPSIESGVDYSRIEGGDRQLRGHISGQMPVGATLDLRGRLDFVDLDDNLIQFTDGSTGALSNDYYRGELTIAHDFGTRWEGQASLFGSDDAIGAGLTLQYRDAANNTRISTGYNQPSWDYTESIAQGGTRDFASIDFSHSVSRQWYLDLGLGLNRFGRGGEEDAATSTELRAGLRWALPIESPTRISIGYAFDAEYVDHVAMRPDGIGGVYPLLPLRDRVLHRIDTRISEQLSPSFFTGFYIGYAKDMNGESGALGGIEFAYEPVENLRIALSADYSNVADRSGQSGAYVHGGLSVTRTFAIEGGETDGR